jgi:hypothetical protein
MASINISFESQEELDVFVALLEGIEDFNGVITEVTEDEAVEDAPEQEIEDLQEEIPEVESEVVV